MGNPFQLAQTLQDYVTRSGYTVSHIARLADIPHPTLVNWLEGRVKKPRYWDTLVRLAAVLGLNEEEATRLLQSAGHPSIEELLRRRDNEHGAALLAPWAKIVTQRQQAPFQVIADLPYFVGRERILQSVKTALLDEQSTVCSLQGMGGAGKTTLAARIAYLLRPHFADGVLWARVDHSDTMSILSAFAAAYDRDVSQYTDVASRSQVVRTLLADKRALIVLDNVRRSEEVRPLIPPTGSCAVVITTRRHDLAVSRGIHRFDVGPFDEDAQESLLLLEQLLGTERVQKERPALAEIAALVGHLPLAVAIVAGRLAYEHDWSAAEFAKRLRQGKKRLAELAYEDQAVALSFNLSYEALEPEQQRFFAALSVFAGEDFSVEAAVYVTQQPEETVQDNLRKLHSLSLIQPGRRRQRYRLHPLLRDYARAKLQDERPLWRMAEYFIEYVRLHERDYKTVGQESSNIHAALLAAWQQKLRTVLIQGTEAFFRYLLVRGHHTPLERYLAWAQEAATQKDDKDALARVLVRQGERLEHLTEYAQANQRAQEALSLAKEIGNEETISKALTLLGKLAYAEGNLDQAERHYREGLASARRGGCSENAAFLLNALGVLTGVQGQYGQAKAFLQEGLDLVRQVSGAPELFALLFTNLGSIAFRQGDLEEATLAFQEGLAWAPDSDHGLVSFLLFKLGRIKGEGAAYEQAKAYYRKGLERAQRVEDKDKIALLLAGLGDVMGHSGECSEGEAHLQEAMQLVCEKHFQLFICLRLGELYLRCGFDNKAGQIFDEILETAEKLDYLEYIPAARYGLARVAAAKQDRTTAHQLGQQSLASFRNLGHRKTAEVAAWLASIPE